MSKRGIRIDYGWMPSVEGSVSVTVSPETARTIWKAQNEAAVWQAEVERKAQERDV